MRTIEEVIAELRKDIHSDVYLGKKTINTYLDEILEIHKAERPQGKWISVSERLPDSAGYYCVTVKNGNDTYVTEEMWSSNFQGNNGFHNYLPVIAWCSLPEPYKEAENE